MWSKAREIAAGDTVILWLTRDALQPLIIEPGKEFNSKFGSYRHADLVGIPFGSKVGSRTGNGFIHVLRPTPELWTIALPHRTQILYLADIAFITSYLNIKNGSQVVEAGTGSGSFSHSVMRSIGASGHLWSYEFHETRANKARQEFQRHGLSDRVTLTHRNVCKDGFTVTDTADALFLDLPAPWDAIEHAKKALRKDRIARICCFSPCIEQVLRTVSALNDSGFTDITMYETLLRPYDIQQTSSLPTIGEISDKLKQSEIRREEKRLKQIASGHRGGTDSKSPANGNSQKNVSASGGGYESSSSHGEKRKRDGLDGEDAGLLSDEPAGGKRAKTEEEDIIDVESQVIEDPQKLLTKDVLMDGGLLLVKAEEVLEERNRVKIEKPPLVQPMKIINLSKVMPEVRGHTSYLTFACLLPPLPTIGVVEDESLEQV
ncbi:MAG: tRNA methyltransferase complex GCD14 subunit [Lentinula lateritia]|uniref:tRNA (adenine(58)-N(1))-methyltransferase catalytic subunit TRM61 n=1 Tax=Lentinula lateritia TaxID=40482 RepID=A0ABQ8V3V3_9AGAR|nr:MAG: tRNA methyltransferase complex GCD14 subunit [Lentinula lateritia]KAJ4472745.1 tRNA methyltransferase complex GCD14 subunit-domain-containing protein [Lentinula lateritia]